MKVPPQENSQLPTINHKNFFIEFLADLRLCNRSIKRTIKNHDDLKGTYKYYTEEGLSRSWLFPSSKQPIIDIHKLSKGAKPVRTDEVKGLGSYRTVYNIITQIKDLINEKLNKIDKTTREIKDSDIASWIKLGMHGKLSDKLQYFSIIKTSSPWLIENILKDLTRIIYLMFGCEVMRNPAALIYSYMALDLIEHNEITWEEALDLYENKIKSKKNPQPDGGRMPMSMKDAIIAARKIHKDYCKYMPIPYIYDRNEVVDTIKDKKLIIREHKITLKWLEMKLKDDKTRPLEEYCSFKDTTKGEAVQIGKENDKKIEKEEEEEQTEDTNSAEEEVKISAINIDMLNEIFKLIEDDCEVNLSGVEMSQS